MTTRPTWVRKVYATLAVLAGLGLLGAWFTYSQLTAELDPGAIRKPNELDGQEAEKKLRIYHHALETSRPGFIRLSDSEINSYLEPHYFSGQRAVPPPTESPVRLLTGRLELLNGGGVWYCWVRRTCLGHAIDMVWERTFRLEREADRWALRTKSMRLGRLQVPRVLWPFVRRQLGSVDDTFAKKADWLARLPNLEIRTNEASISPELRLFTYASTDPQTGRP